MCFGTHSQITFTYVTEHWYGIVFGLTDAAPLAFGPAPSVSEVPPPAMPAAGAIALGAARRRG